MIDTVIFDLGNVLLPFDWGLARERMCQRTGCSRRELEDYLMATPHLIQLELGQVTAPKFFEIIQRDLRLTGSYAEFAQMWSDIFTVDEEMRQLAESLRGKYRRYVLSNTIPMHIDFIFAQYPFVREMDGHILSYEVGAMKPDRRIYEATQSRFGFTAERAVFIDDLPANIEAARGLGWQGIVHRHAAATRAELTKLGVLPI